MKKDFNMKITNLELLNKLSGIQNTQEALGFLSLSQFIIIFMYIVVKGF